MISTMASQAYPLTPLFGATVGYLLGSLFAAVASVIYLFAAYDISETAPQPGAPKESTRKRSGKTAKQA